ncbi:MAG: saccharopine dehydrogenase C-terminal domain-containing protein [Thermoflexales bacterium]
MKILLLGVGMQGKVALYDLVRSPSVTEIIAADMDVAKLRSHVDAHGWGHKVRCQPVDGADPASLDRLMAMKPDVAIDLLPAVFIPNVARAAIERGVHLVNSNYLPAELRALGDTARARGVTVLPEFGLDPGLDLVMLGDASRALDVIEEIHSYGSGIPELAAANNPLRYKVSWTFEGVLKAYRRPARAIRDGVLIDIDRTQVFAPENVRIEEVAGLGALEVYPNGDAVAYAADLGLDPASLRAAGRYTMRWPGHCAFWKTIVDLHLLDLEPVVVDGAPVDRLRYLAAALGPHLQYAPGERDVAIVIVEVIGRKDRQRKRLRYTLVDLLDPATGFSAMSRTVGFTTSIAAQMIASGKITQRGLLSPINDVPYAAVADELGKRGVKIVFEASTA